MKFIHLSDLHIGKCFKGLSMLEEQRHVFGQIIGYIQAERPDAVVIAGDIYDRVAPGGDAVRLFDDFLTELAGEDVAVLIISGNHDSPERLTFASRLLSDKRLFLCGAYDGTLRKVTLRDERGEVHFWLLPFIRPSSVRGFIGEREIETYSDALAAILESAGIEDAGRNVLVSHQFFTSPGVIPVRSESEVNPVGGLDAIDAALLSRFDYVALGHLHGAQRVGDEKIRYAGSPLKYSFSEWKQRKSITLVELGEKGELTVMPLPLTPLREMREIRGVLDLLMSGAVASQGGREDYLRVILTDEEEIIDPMGKLRSVYPHVMSLDFENSRTSVDAASVAADCESVENLSSYDLFSDFFLEMSGAVMSDEQAKLMRQLLDSAAI